MIRQESNEGSQALHSLTEILEGSSDSTAALSAAAAATDHSSHLAYEVAVMFSVQHLNIVQARGMGGWGARQDGYHLQCVYLLFATAPPPHPPSPALKP